MMGSVAVEMSPATASTSNGDDGLHRSSLAHATGTTPTTVVTRPPRTSYAPSPSNKSKEKEGGPEQQQQQPDQPTEWGQNFWVTLIDPQSQAQFYACPSTGQTTWDAPAGNFVLPPSSEGEWWELRDETRDGIPYYYHTQSGDTTWTKPDGFVIPLGIIQNTSLGRKLSQSTRRHSQLFPTTEPSTSISVSASPRRHPPARRTAAHSPPSVISERSEDASGSAKEREKELSDGEKRRKSALPPSANTSSSSDHGHTTPSSSYHIPSSTSHANRTSTGARSRSKSSGHLSAGAGAGKNAQSLTAAVEFLSGAGSGAGRSAEATSAPEQRTVARAPEPVTSAPEQRSSPHEEERRGRSRSPERRRMSIGAIRLGVKTKTSRSDVSVPATPTLPPASPLRTYSSPIVQPSTVEGAQLPNVNGAGKSPRRPIPAVPSLSSHTDAGFWRQRRNTSAGNGPAVNIGQPVFDLDATKNMSPVSRSVNGTPMGKPIHVATKRLSTGEHPLLPRDLVSEIQQFAQSDFARRYFSTHREGLIFRRKVPVERMMMWQKVPLTSPLLVMNKSLHRDAVKVFKVLQRIMGDRDRDHRVRHTDSSSSLALAASASTNALLEEERWLLGEGIHHGEMRDEIYCQVIKQLSGNSNTESTFRGWQLMCVLLVTFPPSKNFEPYVRSFFQQHTTQSEGRVDVMAKYCLQRLTAIAKKGPRGKPPSIAEIESASDAAFNPSTFGESLDAIFRLQERTYADLKVPVILPFLSDGILALGGTKQEGIFRVPGDADAVSELRLRIDKGVYTLDGIDDPHVPASLLKLWLRELLDPLVPQELYNECVACANEPERVVAMVGRLPTIHRRVVLFVISFLQLFLEERVLQATKMTSANLALVMAPNLLRCSSDSMAVVFTNATYEHRFVHNLLLHLRCDKVDPEYVPEHGKGAVPTPVPRKSHQKSRRPKA